jgi:C-terminal processing protease CtpA/Prc
VKHHRLISLGGTLLAGIVLATAIPAVSLVADTPAAGAKNSPTDAEKDAERQLEVARKNLEKAAQDVARLSAELSTHAMEDFMPMLEPGRSILGVQVERAPEGPGARVREVSPGGPAAEAGIHTGDVIVALNGTTLTRSDPSRQVLDIMRSVKPDSHVSVRVLRDGKTQDFTVTARASPSIFATTHGFDMWSLPDMPGTVIYHRPLGDLELVTLTPGLGSYFGTDKGVLVVRAPADGALKLQEGDVILAIDGRQPTSGSHATRILGSYQPGEKIKLRVLRQRKTLELEASLPDRPMRHEHEHERLQEMSKVPAIQPRRMVIFGSNSA